MFWRAIRSPCGSAHTVTLGPSPPTCGPPPLACRVRGIRTNGARGPTCGTFAWRPSIAWRKRRKLRRKVGALSWLSPMPPRCRLPWIPDAWFHALPSPKARRVPLADCAMAQRRKGPRCASRTSRLRRTVAARPISAPCNPATCRLSFPPPRRMRPRRGRFT